MDPIAYWNEQAGPRWVALQEQLDRLLNPLGLRAMKEAAIRPGERVLDVGCGCGQSTLQLSEQVGADGLAVGVDVCQVMLARARQRANWSALNWSALFWQADAASHPFHEDPFDAVFSRFGLMFFSHPQQAFANLRRALYPGGRMVAVCWRDLEQNPLFEVALRAAAPFLDLPDPTPHDLPGPFSLAPPGKAEQLLIQAGFAAVQCQPFEDRISVGGLEESTDFLLQMGPVVPLLAEATPCTVAQVKARLRQLLQDYQTSAGVFLPTANWLLQGISQQAA
ncbi:class I SAM-dependent methyltransferase [bacterium]|nr:class I SAM-dependent methyltransferase [bacterium]